LSLVGMKMGRKMRVGCRTALGNHGHFMPRPAAGPYLPGLSLFWERRSDGMKQWIARHHTAVFLVLTYGISWPLWLASGALTCTPIRIPDLSWLVAQIGVFAPAFAGMAIGACIEPGSARRALRSCFCCLNHGSVELFHAMIVDIPEDVLHDWADAGTLPHP
jgi:hypothetical protein